MNASAKGGRRAGSKAAATRKTAGKGRTSGKGAPPKERSRGARILRGLVLAGLTFFLLGVAAFAYVYAATDIPDPNEDFEAQTTFVYYADGKTELGRFATQNRVSIPLADVPQHVQDAVIAAEDRSFWTNQGLDPRGILRAAFSNATSDSTQGASTITQQYVKVLYLTQDRTWSRKLKEAFLSLKVHRQKDKPEILEGYLNTIYFGRGAYGIEAAAQAYFDTSADELNVRQAAALAAIINSPTRFDPANGEDARARLEQRYSYVLDGMAETESVDASEAAEAAEQLPKFPKVKASDRFAGQKGHVMRLVRQQLLAKGYTDAEIDSQGLRVTTTFTRPAMRAARAGVLENRPKGLKGLHAAVASVEPGSGALRGMFGGQDFLDSEINWAAAGGQPGSTFKMFALAAGLDQGFSLEDTFDGNSPYELPDGTDVENQGNTSYGSSVNLITATANSINTAFIDLTLAMDEGPKAIVSLAEDFGIPKDSVEPVTGVALGSARVSAIAMANAFGTIANEGEGRRWYAIQEVKTRRGEVDFREPRKETERLYDRDLAADVSYALQQVVSDGSGTNAQLAGGRPAAGKTGTATNDKGEVSSSWFVGYTPQLTTAVMYVRGDGNDQLEGFLPTFFGGEYPARTFKTVMDRWHDGRPVESFPPPVFVDGDAPSSGHEPPPPPPPEPEPAPQPQEPQETQEPEKTKEPEPTREPSPTPTPTPSPSPTDCTLIGGCETDPPEEEPTESPESNGARPPGNGNGSGNGNGNGRRIPGRRLAA